MEISASPRGKRRQERGRDSSLALREATNHSEKAQGTRVHGTQGRLGSAGGVGSEYGGLVLGATRGSGGVSGFEKPTGAGQRLQVRFWLQKIHVTLEEERRMRLQERRQPTESQHHITREETVCLTTLMCAVLTSSTQNMPTF